MRKYYYITPTSSKSPHKRFQLHFIHLKCITLLFGGRCTLLHRFCSRQTIKKLWFEVIDKWYWRCACVCVLFDIIDKSWGECPLAWCEAVCGAGSGERGRELISTLAPLPLLLLLPPGSWIKHLFDLYQECIGQSTPVSVFLSACLSLIVPHVCTQTPLPLPALFSALLYTPDSPSMQWPLVMAKTKAKTFSHLHEWQCIYAYTRCNETRHCINWFYICEMVQQSCSTG